MNNEAIEFVANSEAEAVKALNRLCNDGRCWIINSVFSHVYAYPFGRERFPRETILSAARSKFRFWRSGAWHPINAVAVAKAERWDQWQADNASGVRD